jgi:hypothetical protein
VKLLSAPKIAGLLPPAPFWAEPDGFIMVWERWAKDGRCWVKIGDGEWKLQSHWQDRPPFEVLYWSRS